MAITLNQQLGQTQHYSVLSRKLDRLGLGYTQLLEALAVKRGAYHYPVGKSASYSVPDTSEENLSTEELITGLLLGQHPHRPQLIRLAAQLLATPGLSPKRLATLAVQERCLTTISYITQSARNVQQAPEQTKFWTQLAAELNSASKHSSPSYDTASGVLPHPSRFVAQTGYVRGGNRTAAPQKPDWLAPILPQE